MAEPVVEELPLSEARAKGLRRLLLAILALAVVLVLLATAVAVAGPPRFAVVVGVIGVALLASTGLTLRALPARGQGAKRGCIITAVFLILFAVPLAAALVGLVMVIAGVLLLFLLFTPEREPA